MTASQLARHLGTECITLEGEKQGKKAGDRRQKSEGEHGAVTNAGNVSETMGSKMGAKGVVLGGLGREKGGEKGVFVASEAGKKALFGVPEGKLAGGEGFSGQNRTLCQCQSPDQIYPQGRCEG